MKYLYLLKIPIQVFIFTCQHVDYPQVEKEVVSRLLNGYGPEKDKIIVNVAVTTGGFATQVRALMGSVMAALLSGRKLRSKKSYCYSLYSCVGRSLSHHKFHILQTCHLTR